MNKNKTIKYDDEHFIAEAIKDARKHNHHYGAIIVRNNKIVASAGKRPDGDARSHAETQAILKACKKLKNKTLNNCILYSTCEPCPMCFYMAWITNISKIVYGATIQDSINFWSSEINVSAKLLNKKGGNKIELKGKVLRNDCLKLFKN